MDVINVSCTLFREKRMLYLSLLSFFLININAYALPGEDFIGEGGCVCKTQPCNADEVLYLANHCQTPIELPPVPVPARNELYLCPGCNCSSGYFGIKDEFYLPSKFRKLGSSYSKKKTMLTCHKFSSFNLEKVMNCVTQTSTPQSCPLNINTKSCDTIDSLLPPTLIASYEAKRNCGFSWEDFTADGNQNKYFRNLKAIKDDRPQSCYKSMCTTTTFNAFVIYMKEALKNGKITQAQFDQHTKWQHSVGSLGYDHINLNATPDALVEELGIGKGHQQHVSELGQNNLPKAGDLVQLWRKSGSGHSVIFKGLVDTDGDKKYDLMCYVSSQSATNGVGEICEDTKYLDRILIGSLDELKS